LAPVSANNGSSARGPGGEMPTEDYSGAGAGANKIKSLYRRTASFRISPLRADVPRWEWAVMLSKMD
jgi:hypothetical protein